MNSLHVNNTKSKQSLHNVEIEKKVLAAAIKFPDAREKALKILVSEDFHDPRHVIIFRALNVLHGKYPAGFDLLVLADYLRQIGEYETIVGNNYLAQEVIQADVTGAYIQRHCKIVKDYAVRREAARQAQEILNNAGNYELSVIQQKARKIATILTGAADDEDDKGDFTPIADPWPAPLDEAAYHGLAGEFVRLVNPHSESDPAADLVQFLTCFGNAIGRGPHWTVSATDHHLNLFINLVGKTARGRKGTSLDVVLKVFGQVDEVWRRDCVTGGLSSGEGLKYAVRDPVIKNGEIVDHGVVHKRLLVVESEFANVLKVLNREGNTLSPTVRQAWESGTIKNLTKHDSITATGAHISIVGHITQDELLKRLAETESSNGFTNRFLWFAVRRSKLLPRGGNLDESALNSLVIRLHGVLEAARNVGEMGMTENAWTIWDEIYEDLSRGIPGLLGLVTARAEAQVRRLACLYALLDQSDIVDVPHLKAALAVWRYAEDSARYIFGDATGNPVADTIMSHLRQSPDGLTRKQIREEIFQRNKSSREIGVALNMLEEAGMARKERIQTGGRPAERWYALTP